MRRQIATATLAEVKSAEYRVTAATVDYLAATRRVIAARRALCAAQTELEKFGDVAVSGL